MPDPRLATSRERPAVRACGADQFADVNEMVLTPRHPGLFTRIWRYLFGGEG